MATAAKRRRAPANVAPRKRASTACQVCRIKKVKCDNGKPSCGFCIFSKAKCVYPDQDTPEYLLLLPSYDPASQKILERLDYITAALDDFRGNGTTLSSVRHPHESSRELIDSETQEAPSASHQLGYGSSDQLDYPGSPFSAAACESILHWPIFEGVISEEHRSIQSFPLDSNADFDDGHSSTAPQWRSQSGTGSVGRGIHEDDLVPLCKKFLAGVHLRNPILDGSELLHFARDCAENGLGWNGQTCLVLVASALACCSTPWRPMSEAEHPELGMETDPGENYDAAEAYYMAAKKRVGLLHGSIIDIQCLFFASIYEKHMLHPLRAWSYIQQACAHIQVHLLRKGRKAFSVATASRSQSHHLEQRLYWSCVKAESELMLDIPLRPSGILEFRFPDTFPSPPARESETSSPNMTFTPEEISSPEFNPGEARSWFFYLAEISLRRTMNQAITSFYRHSEREWTQKIQYIHKQYTECEPQISLWYSHLPSAIKFNFDEPPNNELAFYLKGRFLEWRELILRPFLYFALHQHPNAMQLTQMIPIANDCLKVCADQIQFATHPMRHGGTWFTIRKAFSSALLILAAVLKTSELDACGSNADHPQLQVPSNWEQLIGLALSVIKNWAHEAPDIATMYDVLDDAYRETYRRVPYQ